MIYAFSTCLDSIRTIPALQHDQTRAEDVDTEGEDHAGDEWRYACMSRPYIREIAKPKDVLAEMVRPKTFDEMMAEHEREREDA